MKNCYYRKGIRIAVIGDNILVRKCCLHNVPNTMDGLIEAAKVKYVSSIEKYIISVDDFLKSTDVKKTFS